ncbi:MAG: homoserine kinase [Actinomycetota bacterium]
MRFTVRVPATSANLGAGFDCLGLALDLCNEVTIDTDADPGVRWEGEGVRELPTDGSDMVSRAMERVATSARVELESVALHGVNRIPLERGLGSSSAAAVAGIVAAHVLLDPGASPDRDAIFAAASELEGHPDNAAAAVFGGLTIATGSRPPVRLDPHPDLRPVLLIPADERLPTELARRALTPQVPREDAVFNLQRSALAVVAFTQRPELLSEALEDRLHQDARLALVPEVRVVFDRLRSAGVPVCVSGAGPTLLSFASAGDDAANPLQELGNGWRRLEISVRSKGVEILR